jgi:RNA polymerase sigma-70 factor, ECF subfamily
VRRFLAGILPDSHVAVANAAPVPPVYHAERMPPDDSSAALVARALRGDGAAFEVLVRRHLRAAYVVALAIVHDPQEAEDLAQDAMVTAFERLDTCREPEKFPGWLMQVVRNRALNALASRRARARVRPDATDAAPPAAGDAALRRRLLAALDGVSEIQRTIVLLHDLHEWTHAEIGAALEISELMSRQHLFVARRKLRAELEGEAPSTETGHGR